MIYHEQRDSFDFCRRREPQHRLAGAVGANSIVLPSFLCDLAFGIDDLERAFVPLRLRGRTPLGFFNDLPRVLLE